MQTGGMTSLQQEMRACRRCLEAGYEITPGAIFTGQQSAEVMVIGQAPGVTEVAAGRPFNASSGRRLFQWLGEAGWEETDFRRRHYMTAVTKCFPGKSPSGRGDRVPGKEEQAMCRSYLDQELYFVSPRLIIPVGGLAIKLFYPASAKLKQIIGSAAYFKTAALVHSHDPFDLERADRHTTFVSGRPRDGRWVVPLPHPSGASAWPNQAGNRALIARAISILAGIRMEWNL